MNRKFVLALSAGLILALSACRAEEQPTPSNTVTATDTVKEDTRKPEGNEQLR